MTYRYRPPMLPSEPGTDEAPPVDAGPSELLVRRTAMRVRYAELFRDLTQAFAPAPNGLWPRIQALAPAVAQTIDDTDRYAEDIAVAYVAGLVKMEEFERALSVHKDAWIRGVEVLIRATPPFPAREACIQCGDTTMTTAVRDDQGALQCHRCLQGACLEGGRP